MFLSNIFRPLDDDIYQQIIWPYHSHQPKRPNVWTATLALEGFEPKEVQIKEEKSESGEVKVVIHAKHEEGDDFNEVKKAVKIPANVDNEKLRTIFGKDGILVLKAPYKEVPRSDVEPMKIKREDTWNGIWGELFRLNDHMHNLVDTSENLKFPRTEFVADEGGESGTWRMHVNIGKGFSPSEVKLRSHNDCIQLEAKKEVKGEHGVSSRYISETVSIPEGVHQDQLKSKLFDNGDLILEAPCKKVPKVAGNGEGKPIPIELGKAGDSEKMAVDN